MRYRWIFGLLSVLFVLAGCASSPKTTGHDDEQIDLYLTTLDDKHFVWCKLDLEQCQKDFEKWRVTSRGQALIREYEKEASNETFQAHQVQNIFRTGFVDEEQLARDFRELNESSEAEPGSSHSISGVYGPELPD